MKLIGVGRTAEVYDLLNNTILKLYYPHVSKDNILRDYEISKKVMELHLKIPKVYGMKEVENRLGIIYEKISGPTLLEIIFKNPLKAKKIGREMARLHKSIHKETNDQSLGRLRDYIYYVLNKNNYLNTNVKERIKNILNNLEEKTYICHFDFHPDNILVDNNVYYIIDWTTAAIGNPLADVARTSLLLQYGTLPTELPLTKKIILMFIRKRLLRGYLTEYNRLHKYNKIELLHWKIIMAFTRLNENIPNEEKEALVKLINENLNR